MDASSAPNGFTTRRSRRARRSSGRPRCALSVTSDEIDQRVEVVVQQPTLPEDFVQQLDVLDRRRRLPGDLAREVQELSSCGELARRRALETSVPRARRQPRSGATIGRRVRRSGAAGASSDRPSAGGSEVSSAATRVGRRRPGPDRAASQRSRARRSCSQMVTARRIRERRGFGRHGSQGLRHGRAATRAGARMRARRPRAAAGIRAEWAPWRAAASRVLEGLIAPGAVPRSLMRDRRARRIVTHAVGRQPGGRGSWSGGGRSGILRWRNRKVNNGRLRGTAGV